MRRCIHFTQSCSLALFIILVVIMHSTTHAQFQSKNMNVWVFGAGAGIDFSNGKPVTIKSSSKGFGEGGASICDVDGQLLFYTNGTVLWDKVGDTMPNGSDLPGIVNAYPAAIDVTTSTTQSSAIVASPVDADIYYVFTLTSEEVNSKPAPVMGRLYYCIVDMKLNNGRGDVIAGKKSILIDSGFTEKMTVVKGDNCNAWLLLQKNDRVSTYHSYEITASGVNATPVVSSNGLWIGSANYNPGVIKVSHDRRKVVSCNWNPCTVTLFDFNAATGILSNEVVLDAPAPIPFAQIGYYGAAFSPDNTKLYAIYLNTLYLNSATNGYPFFMYQFDLSNANPAGTRKIIGRTNITDIRLAPDSMLYFCTGNAQFLGRVMYPNKAGGACKFDPQVVPWLPGTYGYSGLPNDVVPISTDTVYPVNRVSISHERDVILHAPKGYDRYIWDDGSTDTVRTVSGCGTYYVQATKYGCYEYHTSNDTFIVEFDPQLILGKEDVSCSNDSKVWATPELTGAIYTYEWRNSNNDILRNSIEKPVGDTLYDAKRGSYKVIVSRTGCSKSYDAVIENASTKVALVNVTPDTTIKYGAKLQLTAEGADSYTWSPATWLSNTSIADPVASPENDIVYIVTGVNADGCIDTAMVKIVIDFTVSEYVPSVFSPNGDGRNDLFRLINMTSQQLLEFKVYSRWGEEIFSTTDTKGGWDGTYNGRPADIGVYYYVARVRQYDGAIRSYKGDVTLVR